MNKSQEYFFEGGGEGGGIKRAAIGTFLKSKSSWFRFDGLKRFWNSLPSFSFSSFGRRSPMSDLSPLKAESMESVPETDSMGHSPVKEADAAPLTEEETAFIAVIGRLNEGGYIKQVSSYEYTKELLQKLSKEDLDAFFGFLKSVDPQIAETVSTQFGKGVDITTKWKNQGVQMDGDKTLLISHILDGRQKVSR